MKKYEVLKSLHDLGIVAVIRGNCIERNHFSDESWWY